MYASVTVSEVERVHAAFEEARGFREEHGLGPPPGRLEPYDDHDDGLHLQALADPERYQRRHAAGPNWVYFGCSAVFRRILCFKQCASGMRICGVRDGATG